MRAIAFRHSLELGRGDHGKFSLMIGQFLCRHANEQLLHKQGVPGILGDDLDRQPVVLVGPGE